MTLRSEEESVRMLCVRDRRYPQPHWILLARRVRHARRAGREEGVDRVEGAIALDATYLGGPLLGRASRVATFDARTRNAGAWITLAQRHVDGRLRGLGLGTHLFNEVVAWAQSLELPDVPDQTSLSSAADLRVADLIHAGNPRDVSVVALEEGLATMTTELLRDQRSELERRHGVLQAALQYKVRLLTSVALSLTVAALAALVMIVHA